MTTRPFRFIHASDFHLEQPLMGVAEVPDHLRSLFVDAPYTAAKAVFDAVLAEDADFLVLSGDLVHPLDAGPRGPLFLVEQFSRLAERGIGVYWAGGTVDPPEAWPPALALPQNVHVFPPHPVEEMVVHRDGEPIAKLVGVSRDRHLALRPVDFSRDATGLYTIAAAHGDADPTAMQSRMIDCWAFGGRHDRGTPQAGPQWIHYCGSPQGRCPEESGVHGCTLVQVDSQRQTRTTLIPTDSVRWFNERVMVEETMTFDDLQMRLRDRMHSILDGSPSSNLLISWTLAVGGRLRRGLLDGELLQGLRNDYGYRSPAAWSVSLDIETAETLPPEWYEQETILGDFLRAVRQLQMNPQEPLALESYMAESHLAGALGGAASFASKMARDHALREAAALGVNLLSGEEAHA